MGPKIFRLIFENNNREMQEVFSPKSINTGRKNRVKKNSRGFWEKPLKILNPTS
jgi:hypothetical protein